MKYFTSLLSLLILFSSCKKDKTKEELLLGDWQLNALTIDPPQLVNGAVITNWYSQLEDCDKDNILSFFDTKIFVADEGPTNCDTLDPQNISGNWIFLNNETELRLVHDTDTAIYTLIDLNEDLIKMSYSERDSSNIMHTLTATFGKL